jgi:hypothetical protein
LGQVGAVLACDSGNDGFHFGYFMFDVAFLPIGRFYRAALTLTFSF